MTKLYSLCVVLCHLIQAGRTDQHYEDESVRLYTCVTVNSNSLVDCRLQCSQNFVSAPSSIRNHSARSKARALSCWTIQAGCSVALRGTVLHVITLLSNMQIGVKLHPECNRHDCKSGNRITKVILKFADCLNILAIPKLPQANCRLPEFPDCLEHIILYIKILICYLSEFLIPLLAKNRCKPLVRISSLHAWDCPLQVVSVLVHFVATFFSKVNGSENLRTYVREF